MEENGGDHERQVGWLEVLGELSDPAVLERPANLRWAQRFCVFFPDEKILGVFHDEEDYIDRARFTLARAEFRRRSCSKSEFKRSDSIVRRRRRQSLGSTGNKASKFAELTRKISHGIRSTRSKSVSTKEPQDEDRFLQYIARQHEEVQKFQLQLTNSSSSTPSGRLSHRHKFALSRSHESLLSDHAAKVSAVETIDLSLGGRTHIRPIHPSILCKQHCFQITTPFETKYFACRTSEELQKWIASLRQAIHPTRDEEFRTDTRLTAWVVEAKGLQAKKRYFCEVILNNALYGRTSSKVHTDSLFWGEQFAFEDLPQLTLFSVHIYKEADKKKRKEKCSFAGSVDIPISLLDTGSEIEQWFPITVVTGQTKGNLSDSPSIRIKAKYQEVSVLPLKYYSDLLDFLKGNYLPLCQTLEPVLSAKAKDALCQSLLRILQASGKATFFLADVVMEEVNKSENVNLLFRGNSFATKAMDTYMKMVGEKYLEDTLGEFIQSVYEFDEECEVDPARLVHGSLESNQENLRALVEKAWNHILCSHCSFPSDLQRTFHLLWRRCFGMDAEISTNLISGSVFLRFLCPAILSPSLFHLVQEYPDERTSRTLTLVAKVIQNLANLTRFGSKEEYMCFMNDFVEREFANMRHFLNRVSEAPVLDEQTFEGNLDLGRELAMILLLLNEYFSNQSKETIEKLSPLEFILDSLREVTVDSQIKEESDVFTSNQKRCISSPELSLNQTSSPVQNITATRPSRSPSDPHYRVSASTRQDGSSPTSAKNEERRMASLQVPGDDPNKSIRSYSDSSTVTFFCNEQEDTDQDNSVFFDHSSNRLDSSSLSITPINEAPDFNMREPTASFSKTRSKQSNLLQTVEYRYKAKEPQKPQREVENSQPAKQGGVHSSKKERPRSFVIDSKSRVERSDQRHQATVSPGKTPQKVVVTLGAEQRVSHADTWYFKPVNEAPIEHVLPTSPQGRDSPRYSDLSPTRVDRYSPMSTESSSRCEIHSPRDDGYSSRVEGFSPINERQSPVPERYSPAPSLSSMNKMHVSNLVHPSTPSPPASPKLHAKKTPHQTTKPHRLMSPTGQVSRTPSMHSSSSDSSGCGTRHKSPQQEKRQKTAAEFEEEIFLLKEQLDCTRSSLSEAKQHAQLQEASSREIIANLEARLTDYDDKFQQQREEKDQQMKKVIDRLMFVESELRKEQQEMQEVVKAKQRIVEIQERRIKSLDAANARLLSALNNLRSSKCVAVNGENNPSIDYNSD